LSTWESGNTGYPENYDSGVEDIGTAAKRIVAQADTQFVPRSPLAETPKAADSDSTRPLDGARAFDVATLPETEEMEIPCQSTLRDLSSRKLDDFELIRRLGSGGMADVYLADQTPLQRNIALKVMRSDRIADPVIIQRFKHEATSAAALNHNNVVQIYQVGECNGIHYIAQEYVDGSNLRQYLNREGTPNTFDALRILRQIASALKAASDAGIIHRDIKPENIMVTRKGVVKVADFGLARAAENDDVQLTQDGFTMGTPLYMSPEQINGQKLDKRADIYSFGITAYQLLAGQPPFHGRTGRILASQHLNDEPEPLSNRRQDLPIELCNIIHRMIEKQPEDRYQSAAEILAELRHLEHLASQSETQYRASTNQVEPFQLARFIMVCLLMVVLGGIFGALCRQETNVAPDSSVDSEVPHFNNIEVE